MKIILIAVATVLVAVFFYIDMKWRQWIAARRRDRQ
jgi:hypothetical protein